MKLTYQINQTSKKDKTVQIEDEEFISVEHKVYGSTRVTAFIGKGEGNNEKFMITVSPSGGIFKSERMAGNAVSRAKSLLEYDDCNKIVSNEYFKQLYRQQKERLVIEL